MLAHYIDCETRTRECVEDYGEFVRYCSHGIHIYRCLRDFYALRSDDASREPPSAETTFLAGVLTAGCVPVAPKARELRLTVRRGHEER